MLYDPQLENRLEAKGAAYGNSKLAPTISQVKQEGYKLTQEKDEYKNLLLELAKSDFVQEMKSLRSGIIG